MKPQNKWLYWLWIAGLVVSVAFCFLQIELTAYKTATGLLTDWFYKQMVVTIAPVTPNLAIRGEKNLQADIVSKIYALESSSGKNDACLKKGGYNGYGFRPGTCYNSPDTVKALVVDWVKVMRTKGLSIQELICYYNTGKLQTNCPYYQNYLKI